MAGLGKHSISCLGGHPVCAPVGYTLIIKASKWFGAIKSWESPVLHLNHYLSKFLIINSFNPFSLNQFCIIIQSFSGKQPIFQFSNRGFSEICLPVWACTYLSLSFPIPYPSEPHCLPPLPVEYVCSAGWMWLYLLFFILYNYWYNFIGSTLQKRWPWSHFQILKCCSTQPVWHSLYLGGSLINFVITSWKKAQNDMKK